MNINIQNCLLNKVKTSYPALIIPFTSRVTKTQDSALHHYWSSIWFKTQNGKKGMMTASVRHPLGGSNLTFKVIHHLVLVFLIFKTFLSEVLLFLIRNPPITSLTFSKNVCCEFCPTLVRVHVSGWALIIKVRLNSRNKFNIHMCLSSILWLFYKWKRFQQFHTVERLHFIMSKCRERHLVLCDQLGSRPMNCSF